MWATSTAVLAGGQGVIALSNLQNLGKSEFVRQTQRTIRKTFEILRQFQRNIWEKQIICISTKCRK